VDQAEALAKEWSTSPVPAYRLLGQWVQVFVLAARDQAEPACELAIKALNEKIDGSLRKETGEEILMKALVRMPPFNRMLTEALQRVEAKLGGPGKLPARLDDLLKQSRAVMREGRPPRPSKLD
jgi:hypothetical protein